jgi:hypothetical protein
MVFCDIKYGKLYFIAVIFCDMSFYCERRRPVFAPYFLISPYSCMGNLDLFKKPFLGHFFLPGF